MWCVCICVCVLMWLYIYIILNFEILKKLYDFYYKFKENVFYYIVL